MRKNVTVRDYIRNKALGLNGLLSSDVDPRTLEEELVFVNDIDEIRKNLLEEYNVWYSGDGDKILNFFTRANSIDYNHNPIYNRNKKDYFWAVASTESNTKRSHSGKPRDITDSIDNIVGKVYCDIDGTGETAKPLNDRLHTILDENNFDRQVLQKARPMTLVEGWGAWKINWDTKYSDCPILIYYRANAVDFVFSNNGKLIAIIYQDYFSDEKKNKYILFEIRRTERRECKDGKVDMCLIVEKELYKIQGQSEILTPMKLKDLKQLKDVHESIIIDHYSGFLGCPSIYYEDNELGMPGRSIYAGKCDLFDDLDQCYSQSANAVRKSTVHEYVDVNYLERNEKTGMPVMPNCFNRDYIKLQGVSNGDGVGGTPIQVVQPAIHFDQYSLEEQNILINICCGIISPATLGIDIAKKDNAEAQREKEKVTIFTRNTIKAEEEKIYRTLCNDLMIADELMHKGKITCHKYSINVRYDEFADASFEAKLETVLAGWQAGIMSDKMAVHMLYGNTISEPRLKEELAFIQQQREQSQQSPLNPEDMGMFGELGAENEYNTEHSQPEVSEMIPDAVQQ